MAIWGRLAGRKTYILAGLVIFALVVLVFVGRLTPETASAVIVFAVSGFAVTFRDALGRHQAEELAILKDIAAAGRAAAARNTGSTISQLADAVQRSASLAMSVKGEQTS